MRVSKDIVRSIHAAIKWLSINHTGGCAILVGFSASVVRVGSMTRQVFTYCWMAASFAIMLVACDSERTEAPDRLGVADDTVWFVDETNERGIEFVAA